ncbi:MAG: DNA repair protein RecN [Deltaproteobacteria bacterium]|nr:DNA repair protein RecN [Deltaproteobacteria bacterium]MBW2016740.1 DNA repair protein RecN [Deltaproteobacteria bacterium]MBW2128845.1 DNA repair protein RecN [Deltaproteobacteria bacterium]MBW2302216.1 DNA repair protein RecN [Deltaproteobacteria bacterium]
MLVQLTISNFAIINHLEIHFKEGLNILSGETGAGKSIIINAVNLILGGRASSDLIRTGAPEARVEALFHLPRSHPAGDLLKEFGIPFDEEILVKRIISREGRNRIAINGSLATLHMLSRIGSLLVSISGQHEHQSLLKPENHLYILDAFGGLTDEREAIGEIFGDYRRLKETIHLLEKEIELGEEKLELARFQVTEIDRAEIHEGEDQDLEEEKKRLRYAEQLMNAMGEAYRILYEDKDAVISRLSHCVKELEKGSEIDGRLEPIRDAVASASVELEEAAFDLRELRQRVFNDPHRLEEVEERLQILNRLKRKYGPTLGDVLRHRERISLSEENLARKKEELREIHRESADREQELLSRAASISEKRKKVAMGIEKAVKRELAMLGMKGTRFQVGFETLKEIGDPGAGSRIEAIGPDGWDRVEFLISPNIGEELRPLSKIASGGELSRVMLALKTILARSASVETIIFDEVDAGIGGATAEVVGEKLQSLARYHQLLCISHLHQIASKGTTHFLVEKKVTAGRTQTVISELDEEGRVKEIARMLGGKTVSSRALAHARELLDQGH